MPDLMDAIQERMLREADEILLHRPQQGGAGRTKCANEDCDEAIVPARTALGAQLCLECQQAEEARGAHLRTWARR